MGQSASNLLNEPRPRESLDVTDEPWVPPPPERRVIPFHEVEPHTNLKDAKGTFVVRDVANLSSLGYFTGFVTGPNPEGYYVVVVGSLPSITKQQLLDAQRQQIITQFDVDFVASG
jgi:hypothetical protein